MSSTNKHLNLINIDKPAIIVTGAAGFIGSEFVRQLSDDYHVVAVDSLGYAGNLSNIFIHLESPGPRRVDPFTFNNITFIQDSITDLTAMHSIMQEYRPRYVVNFAAESHVDRSIDSSISFLETNTIGVATLLEAVRGIDSIKNFVQISSDEIYGTLGENEEAWTEDAMLCPRNHYSASKAAGELVALSFYKTHKIPVTISRSSNNLGPFQYPEKLIPLFITNLINDKKVPIYGDGLQKREWIYVSDNCRAIRKIMEDGIPGEIYNIGTDKEFTNIELTKLILKQLNMSTDYIKYVEDRKGHDRRYSINSSKIRKELRWKPEIDFEEGLKTTINWYQWNKSWWQPLIR